MVLNNSVLIGRSPSDTFPQTISHLIEESRQHTMIDAGPQQSISEVRPRSMNSSKIHSGRQTLYPARAFADT